MMTSRPRTRIPSRPPSGGVTPTPVPIKAVEERCTTCGSNHSYNVCPINRGAYDYPVYHDNFQKFQQAAAVGGFVQGNSGYPPSSVASYTRPSGFTQPNPQASRPNQGYNGNWKRILYGEDFERMDSDSDKTKDFDKSSSSVFKSLSDEFEPGGSSYVEGNDLVCYEDFHVSDALFSTINEDKVFNPDPS
ncbi:hypothetical protein Tco_0204236 [Tanacetum coccineum]